jgi:hypothetical protein
MGFSRRSAVSAARYDPGRHHDWTMENESIIVNLLRTSQQSR